jgi:hypothetical protein
MATHKNIKLTSVRVAYPVSGTTPSIQGAKMLNNVQLLDRLYNFWGLGRFESDYWFVGMEEGGGNSLDEVSKRLQVLEDFGTNGLVDNCVYHTKIGYDFQRFFEGKIKLQFTWAKLIRTFLVMRNPNTRYTPDYIKDFQANKWGRSDSDNCLIEIFPLPSPSAYMWNYDKWSDMPILKDRNSYKTALRKPRVDSLICKIDFYKPRLVLMYGMSDEYLGIWSEISRINFGEATKKIIYKNKFIHCGFYKETLFVVTYQPNAVWSNAYWDCVGLKINGLLLKKFGRA